MLREVAECVLALPDVHIYPRQVFLNTGQGCCNGTMSHFGQCCRTYPSVLTPTVATDKAATTINKNGLQSIRAMLISATVDLKKGLIVILIILLLLLPPLCFWAVYKSS